MPSRQRDEEPVLAFDVRTKECLKREQMTSQLDSPVVAGLAIHRLAIGLDLCCHLVDLLMLEGHELGGPRRGGATVDRRIEPGVFPRRMRLESRINPVDDIKESDRETPSRDAADDAGDVVDPVDSGSPSPGRSLSSTQPQVQSSAAVRLCA